MATYISKIALRKDGTSGSSNYRVQEGRSLEEAEERQKYVCSPDPLHLGLFKVVQKTSKQSFNLYT